MFSRIFFCHFFYGSFFVILIQRVNTTDDTLCVVCSGGEDNPIQHPTFPAHRRITKLIRRKSRFQQPDESISIHKLLENWKSSFVKFSYISHLQNVSPSGSVFWGARYSNSCIKVIYRVPRQLGASIYPGKMLTAYFSWL